MTNDEITRMANKIWMAGEVYIGPRIDNLARFAALVASAEREACAKVCDQFDAENPFIGQGQECAKIIRARGHK